MKRIHFLLLVITILCISVGHAQDSPMRESTFITGSVSGTTYTLKRYRSGSSITLYNANNTLVGTTWARKDGQKMSDDIFFGNIDLYEEDTWTRQKCRQIVRETYLSDANRQALQGSSIIVTLYVNSDTGRVIGVEFYFQESSGFNNLSPDYFYLVEKKLKEEIYFTTTATGKLMNYLIRFWTQEF